MLPQLRPTLRNLHDLLTYHHQLGIDAYPQSAVIRLFPEGTAEAVSANQDVVAKRSGVTTGETVVRKETVVTSSMAELCAEVNECRSCSLCQKRRLPVCGRGGESVKLLLVGGWLSLPSPPFSEKLLFGEEEDAMVTRMLQAIKLQESDVFITNVIKCGIDRDEQPQKVHIDTCISYLERQIAMLSPTIICTMGSVATRALLKERQPLSQLRGKFHDYSMDGQKKIPVMPTYHPSFLLDNQEMKKPTWEDLQIIDKALRAAL